jgi:hypothetical protein
VSGAGAAPVPGEQPIESAAELDIACAISIGKERGSHMDQAAARHFVEGLRQVVREELRAAGTWEQRHRDLLSEHAAMMRMWMEEERARGEGAETSHPAAVDLKALEQAIGHRLRALLRRSEAAAITYDAEGRVEYTGWAKAEARKTAHEIVHLLAKAALAAARLDLEPAGAVHQMVLSEANDVLCNYDLPEEDADEAASALTERIYSSLVMMARGDAEDGAS